MTCAGAKREALPRRAGAKYTSYRRRRRIGNDFKEATATEIILAANIMNMRREYVLFGNVHMKRLSGEIINHLVPCH